MRTLTELEIGRTAFKWLPLNPNNDWTNNMCIYCKTTADVILDVATRKPFTDFYNKKLPGKIFTVCECPACEAVFSYYRYPPEKHKNDVDIEISFPGQPVQVVKAMPHMVEQLRSNMTFPFIKVVGWK